MKSSAARHSAKSRVTYPLISEDLVPVEELRISDDAIATVRKPPSDHPLPAIVFLHGGLGRRSMDVLRQYGGRSPTLARFLYWGYATVNATRRAIRHDPQDRGAVQDTLDLVRAVRDSPWVAPDSVFLYGGSVGGSLALEVASVSGEIAGVVTGEPTAIIYMGLFTHDQVTAKSVFANTAPRQLYTPAVREYTRGKLRGIQCPILILHGEASELKELNLDLFVRELQELEKIIVVKFYPGEPHGFYWGQGRDPEKALQANRDAEAVVRAISEAVPAPVAPDAAQMIEVKPMRRWKDQ